MHPGSYPERPKAGAALRPVPIVVDRERAPRPCAACEARAVSVCNAIEACDLARLAEVAQPMQVASGRTFIHEGDAAQAFFNITAGTARIVKSIPDGRRQILGFASVGHFLGIAVSATYAFSAEAIDNVRLCRFARPRLRRLLDDFPALEQRLLEVAANELVVAQEQMLLLGRKTARERIASFLWGRTAGPVPCGPRQLRFVLPMTRADIADYLGLTVETVSRTITAFRKERLIELVGPSEIIVRDPDRLAKLAGAELARSVNPDANRASFGS